jgi:hypothetical protein
VPVDNLLAGADLMGWDDARASRPGDGEQAGVVVILDLRRAMNGCTLLDLRRWGVRCY